MRRYTLTELLELPTLAVGQADDLKVDTGAERQWLSRCTVADGEPFDHKVTTERREHGRWVVVDVYEAMASSIWDRYGFVFRRYDHDTFGAIVPLGSVKPAKKKGKVTPRRRAAPLASCLRRVAEYTAAGDDCMANGFTASACAWWRRAGENYALAMRLYDLTQRRGRRR